MVFQTGIMVYVNANNNILNNHSNYLYVQLAMYIVELAHNNSRNNQSNNPIYNLLCILLT